MTRRACARESLWEESRVRPRLGPRPGFREPSAQLGQNHAFVHDAAGPGFLFARVCGEPKTRADLGVGTLTPEAAESRASQAGAPGGVRLRGQEPAVDDHSEYRGRFGRSLPGVAQRTATPTAQRLSDSLPPRSLTCPEASRPVAAPAAPDSVSLGLDQGPREARRVSGRPPWGCARPSAGPTPAARPLRLAARRRGRAQSALRRDRAAILTSREAEEGRPSAKEKSRHTLSSKSR